jgi:putative Mg2+ transporter-C (MgtC) family protein
MILANLSECSLNAWYADPMLRLLVAASLGSLIGIEREIRGRDAGFRTQLLVALGSALAMVVSLHFARQFGDANPGASTLRIDPARMAYGVMGGIGFLGAGVIMRRETGVKGLTTAASLWCTAAVGLACGFGMYAVAVFATLLVVFTLIVLHRLDNCLPSRTAKTLTVKLPAGDGDNVARVRKALKTRRMRLGSFDYSRDFQSNIETITFRMSIPMGVDEDLLHTIAEEIPELTHLAVR